MQFNDDLGIGAAIGAAIGLFTGPVWGLTTTQALLGGALLGGGATAALQGQRQHRPQRGAPPHLSACIAEKMRLFPIEDDEVAILAQMGITMDMPNEAIAQALCEMEQPQDNLHAGGITSNARLPDGQLVVPPSSPVEMMDAQQPQREAEAECVKRVMLQAQASGQTMTLRQAQQSCRWQQWDLVSFSRQQAPLPFI